MQRVTIGKNPLICQFPNRFEIGGQKTVIDVLKPSRSLIQSSYRTFGNMEVSRELRVSFFCFV